METSNGSSSFGVPPFRSVTLSLSCLGSQNRKRKLTKLYLPTEMRLSASQGIAGEADTGPRLTDYLNVDLRLSMGHCVPLLSSDQSLGHPFNDYPLRRHYRAAAQLFRDTRCCGARTRIKVRERGCEPCFEWISQLSREIIRHRAALYLFTLKRRSTWRKSIGIVPEAQRINSFELDREIGGTAIVDTVEAIRFTAGGVANQHYVHTHSS